MRAIVLTGRGKAFCSGGDVHDIIGPLLSRDFQGLLEFTRLTCDLVRSMRACRRPVVAALNGTVAGAGAVIATACDIRIAAASARIAFLFTKVGLSGADMGAAWLLPRIVGAGRAAELLMTGDFISADEALRIGSTTAWCRTTQLATTAARARASGSRAGPVICARDHEGRAQPRGRDGSAMRARSRGADSGGADAAPGLPGGLRGVSRQARAEIPVKADRGISRTSARRSSGVGCRSGRSHALAAAARAGDRRRGRTEARETAARDWRGGWLRRSQSQDLRGVCLVREAIAAQSPLADAVVALQGLGATALILAGTEAATRALAAGASSPDDVMAAFAMTEPDAGSDVAALKTTRTTRRRRLDPRRREAPDLERGHRGHLSRLREDHPRAGSRGISAFLVPPTRPGSTFAGAQVLAAPHPLGRLRFADCRVPAARIVGEVDRGFKLGMMTLDRLRPTVGAAACGMAARALRRSGHTRPAAPAVRPAAGRHAARPRKDRPDGDRARCRAAARLSRRLGTGRGAERISVSAAMAKSFATEAAQRIVDDAVQIVGGGGVLVGHPVERLYRAVRALRIYEGATDIQRLIIAGSVLDEAANA